MCVLIIFVCYRINNIMEEENTVFSCENMVAAMKAWMLSGLSWGHLHVFFNNDFFVDEILRTNQSQKTGILLQKEMK